MQLLLIYLFICPAILDFRVNALSFVSAIEAGLMSEPCDGPNIPHLERKGGWLEGRLGGFSSKRIRASQ